VIKVEVKNFNIATDRYIRLAKGRLNALAITFIQDMNEEVVRNTPVDTGFLRASWSASIGTVANTRAGTAPSARGVSKDGMGTVSRMNLVGARLRLGQTYYATNGAAYAAHVEYGTSRMAPRAFVRGTLARAPAIAEAAARKVAAL